MIRVYCDRCGDEIKSDRPGGYIGYISIRRGALRTVRAEEPFSENPCEDMHFCEKCIAHIQDFVMNTEPENPQNDPQQTETAQEDRQSLFRAPKDDKLPEAETTAKRKGRPKKYEEKAVTENAQESTAGSRRRRLDYGKIMALHNAGWSNKKIGEEMMMSPGSVATAISTYRKRQKEGQA